MDKKTFNNFVKTLTPHPGVYRMYDNEDQIIYVGKAKNLRNRVSSYVSKSHDSAKTRAMVNNIASIEIVVTNTEADALLLEINLIKEFKPRYNVVFRDDKSYPYLYLSDDDNFPRLSFYRGARKGKGKYFGPYPSAGASRRILNLVQKLFQLRQCDDTFFKNRSRPCLQYQINRCSAPCVGYISSKNYANDINLAMLFMEGNNKKVIKALTEPMLEASNKLEFETAARYRDQIVTLRQFHASQDINSSSTEADIIACYRETDIACVQVFLIRGGLNLGNKCFFQSLKMQETPEELMSIFIKQYYLGDQNNKEMPANIYVSHKPTDSELLEKILSKKLNKNIRIKSQARGEKGKLIRMAMDNANIALKHRLAQNLRYRDRLDALTKFLANEDQINRIECFDISHLSGNETVGSCVVFGSDGAIRSNYRKYNIQGVTAGDDYQAMAQVVNRHYMKIKKGDGILPDLVLIDGGKGQVSIVNEVLKELQLDEAVTLLGIAKGPARKAGLETLILSDGKKLVRLGEDSIILHLLQEIRDEAHRFAITGHRQRRKKKIIQSPLETIEGIGHKRRQKLILHFGGIQGIKKAGQAELAQVPGISKQLAYKIYDTLHKL
ncbi:MAG: excinuclease ABC subunit C [Gammaproteobacteria bacterium]|jgi:excinuclease ABC subunit C